MSENDEERLLHEICRNSSMGREAIQQVLKDVSFVVHQGEILGLVGESGCGKSTLSKAILGFVKDYEGEIIHHTKNPQMVFQDPSAH